MIGNEIVIFGRKRNRWDPLTASSSSERKKERKKERKR